MSETKILATIPGPAKFITDIGLSPQEIEARLRNQYNQKRAFVSFIRKSMKGNIHYRSYQKNGKPEITQDGAFLVCNFFGVIPKYPLEFIKETSLPAQAGEPGFYAVTVKCLIEHPNGAVWEGLGWANSQESNFATRIESQGLGNLRNTIAQMARKRALVNATRHLPFVSELFTEEGGTDENGGKSQQQIYNQRLKNLFGWFKELDGTEDENKIKEAISTSAGFPKVESLTAFVKNEDLWDKFEIAMQEKLSAKAHEKLDLK